MTRQDFLTQAKAVVRTNEICGVLSCHRASDQAAVSSVAACPNSKLLVCVCVCLCCDCFGLIYDWLVIFDVDISALAEVVIRTTPRPRLFSRTSDHTHNQSCLSTHSHTSRFEHRPIIIFWLQDILLTIRLYSSRRKKTCRRLVTITLSSPSLSKEGQPLMIEP